MFKLLACLLLIALALCLPSHPNPTKICQRRGISTSVVKSGVSLVTPLISKGLKGALGMSKGSFDTFRLAAQKESTEGKWLTANFIDLLFVPTISPLTNQLRDLSLKFQNQSQTKDNFMTVIISLAAVVPTLTLFLVLLCFIIGRQTQRVKGSLCRDVKEDEFLTISLSDVNDRIKIGGTDPPKKFYAHPRVISPIHHLRSCR